MVPLSFQERLILKFNKNIEMFLLAVCVRIRYLAYNAR